MGQPVRKTANELPKKKRSGTSQRKVKVADGAVDGRLPSKRNIKVKGKWSAFRSSNRNHPAYGTSKLEVKFQKEFLDRLGVKYIYQFKMESIGRYLDFMVVDDLEHPSRMVAIEVDGVFFHGRGLLYEEMSPMQKRNHRVDLVKNDWCARNGVQLLRIWEDDINKKPDKVLAWLREMLRPFIDGTYDNKRKRH